MIEFKCQHCGVLLRMDDAFAGRDGWCRECKRMVIVPAGGRTFRVEDLPPSEAVARLQQLLSYAARKADQYKQQIAGDFPSPESRAASAAAVQHLRDALANEQRHAADLQTELSSLKTALHATESRLLELEIANDRPVVPPDDTGASRIVELEAALSEEQSRREALEHDLAAQAREVTDLREALDQSHRARDTALEQVEVLKVDLLQARDGLTAARRELDQAQSQTQGQESAIMAFQAEIADREAKLVSSMELLQLREAEIARFQADLALAREGAETANGERDSLLHQIDLLTSERDRLQAATEPNSEDLTRTKAALAALEGRVADVEQERDQLRDHAATTEQRLAQAESALAERSRLLDDAEKAITQQRADVARAEAQCGQLEEALATLRVTLAESEAERDQLREALESGESDKIALRDGLASVQKCSAELELERDRLVEVVESAKEELSYFEAELGEARGRITSLEAERDDLARQLEEKDQRFLGKGANRANSEAVESRDIEMESASEEDANALDHSVPPIDVEFHEPGESGLPVDSEEPREAQMATDAGVNGHDEVRSRSSFVERWHREAEVEGAVKAQFRLAVRYEKGLGVGQDEAEAARWYGRAAAQGHPGAQFHLGRLYAEGRGMPRDIATALTWYRKAADQGETDAQYELGLMCLNGTGVSKDLAAALEWLRRAAEKDDARALFHLGRICETPEGKVANPVEALKYFRRAAELGQVEAQFRLGQLLLSAPNGSRDDRAGADWLLKAAEQGHPEAQLAYAVCLQDGKGVVQHFVRAYAWFSLAAVQLDDAQSARDKLMRSMSPEQVLEGQMAAAELEPKVGAAARIGAGGQL